MVATLSITVGKLISMVAVTVGSSSKKIPVKFVQVTQLIPKQTVSLFYTFIA
jgi:hypothetical protein